jgi:cation diffusion facilitator CzcD-associated flavoprotein CzcO
MNSARRYSTNNSSRNSAIDVAIIGAGPYGLSTAAHLSAAGVPFRIFGEPMEGWLRHMPEGMRLKSEGFASNIYDPDNSLTLKQYCSDNAVPYADVGHPVEMSTFTAYGIAFQERLVPRLERKKLTFLSRNDDSFLLRFDDASEVHARNVILAVGLAEFGYFPDALANLPSEFVTHSTHHSSLEPFKGRKLVVVGGGSSAIDIAYLAQEAGADVHLVARRAALRFHNPPTGNHRRSLWQNIRYPMTGMGPGLRARLYTDAPLVFHFLPQQIRRNIVLDFAGPEGGWFSKDPLLNHVQLLLGHTPIGVTLDKERVNIRLVGSDGREKRLAADHIIAATGYRVDLARLRFLSDGLRASLRSAYNTPILSWRFESSVPGLYFIGLPAALSFGPMMRFALGAQYTARRLAQVFKSAPSPYPEKHREFAPTT